MKKRISLLAAAVMAASLVACDQAPKPAETDLTSKEQKVSYLMGHAMARQLQRDGIVPDADALAQGARDALAAASSKVSDEQLEALVDQTVNSYAQVRKESIQQRAAEANLKAGQSFLAENAKKEGVITLPSGLQYKILTEGAGPKPTTSDTVEVHYHGTLVDGTVFDSSVERGETISFGVTRVIKGWTEALQLMPEGSKWELYIPANLAYGAQQRSSKIGPNSTLIFEVELIKASAE